MSARRRAGVALAAFTLAGLSLSAAQAQSKPPSRRAKPAAAKPAKPAAPSAGLAKQVADYAGHYLPWVPESKIVVEKTTQPVPGFSAWRVRRTGRYPSLNGDSIVFISNDRKWFYEGDSFVNRAATPVRSHDDLAWIASHYANLLKTRVTAQLVPDRDAAGMKGVAVLLESGFGPVRVPGLVTTDGTVFLSGTLWDFQSDPRAERRRRIGLTTQRTQGSADAPVTIVEYADMECGYCKFRGRQLDRLLSVNAGVAKVRRHYKFFPLWSSHAWAMKAASAGDCIFRLAGAPALFRFKELAYSRQENLTVSGIDELAITSAEGEGVARPDFLGCYLRDDSFERVRQDLDEGYRLGVNSTPTYFVDGTWISWIEDKLMEEFLRTKFPALKSITYEK